MTIFDLKKSRSNEELSTWLILEGSKIFEIEKNQFCRHVASDTNLIFWKKLPIICYCNRF